MRYSGLRGHATLMEIDTRGGSVTAAVSRTLTIDVSGLENYVVQEAPHPPPMHADVGIA